MMGILKKGSNTDIKVPKSGELAVEQSIKDMQAQLRTDCVAPIEAIEFFEYTDENKETQFGEISFDQLYNLPSIFASKLNMEAFLNRANTDCMECYDLCNIANIAMENANYILTRQIKAAVTSNLRRFFSTHRLDKILYLENYASTWLAEDDSNGNSRYFLPYLSGIITQCMGNVFSVYKDDEESVKASQAMLYNIINQIIIYISSVISFFIDEMITSRRFGDDKIAEVKGLCRDEVDSMSDLFNILSEEDVIKLVMKQVLATDLCMWYNKVLTPIVTNTVNSYFLMNSFVYKDLYKEKRDKMIADNQK